MSGTSVAGDVRDENDEIAAGIRSELDALGLPAVSLMGGPGCGKTSWLERTLERLGDQLTVGVIASDLATTHDVDRLASLTPHATQIITGRGCHLEARGVRRAMAELRLDALDLLVIESLGDLVCPAPLDLGEHCRVAMFSLAGGDDKPAKHPWMVLAADLILLAKTDLAPHVPFDVRRFHEDLQTIRDDVPVLEVSAVSGTGLGTWTGWLRAVVDGF